MSVVFLPSKSDSCPKVMSSIISVTGVEHFHFKLDAHDTQANKHFVIFYICLFNLLCCSTCFKARVKIDWNLLFSSKTVKWFMSFKSIYQKNHQIHVSEWKLIIFFCWHKNCCFYFNFFQIVSWFKISSGCLTGKWIILLIRTCSQTGLSQLNLQYLLLFLTLLFCSLWR